MEKVIVEAESRNKSTKHALHELRRTGKIPAVLYGGNGQSVNLQLYPRQLANVLGTKTKHHTLFQLQVQGGEETLAMVAETQWAPVKGDLRHVDFMRVLMDRKIRVHVPIVTVGESKGIKEQGGVFELLIRELEVECLPADMLDEFTFDVTPMMLYETVRISDLQGKIGDRIRILREPQAVICHVVSPKAVEEVKPEEAVVAEGAVEPEVIKKGKTAEEGEEAEESSGTKPK